MTAIMNDGFDQYDTYSDLTAYGRWSGHYLNSNAQIATGLRNSGKRLVISGGLTVWRNLGSDHAGKTVFTGFSFATDPGAGGVAGSNIFYILKSFTVGLESGQASQMILGLNQFGYLVAKRGSTVVATGSVYMIDGSERYIEVKCKVADSGGIFEVRVNEVVDISFTGDTQNDASNSVVGILICGGANGISFNHYFDDVYICNDQGSTSNTYQGDVMSLPLKPISDASIQFTRSTGSNSYSNVDEDIGNPADTDYNYASVSGYKDEYLIADLTHTPDNIKWVTVSSRVSKSDTGSLQFKHGIRESGGTLQTTTEVPGTGFATYHSIFDTADGVNAWTPLTLSGAKSVIEVL